MSKLLHLFIIFSFLSASAQSNEAIRFFPKGTHLYGNIPYAHDTLARRRLDIYLPANTTKLCPVIFWIHSGGWRAGGKEGDMHYLPHTLHALIKNGYAIVAVNYRFSTTAIFPAQIKDCNQAMAFIYENAGKYQLDPARIALMGFSAGGHLAALMGLSANNDVGDFYTDHTTQVAKPRAVVDFYGLSDFRLIPGAEHAKTTNGPGLLFGGAMNNKPALVKQATPVNYIDSSDPPFLIIHGDKDELMDVRQSICLNDSLLAHGVKSQLMLIKGAPHGGKMFDQKKVRRAVISFLKKSLQ